ncbi:MAG TPA: CaiB/BaiF CoA-transferase family protein [Vicinamibacterales bacterium]|jgi:crotonobetainyl-CoA:carnitine CoA-transferase CaiB-like acyl-CoA transferase|nr:CaiB/BaiF CoA-transferase family protein [Vicinamibacterales bacterium]
MPGAGPLAGLTIVDLTRVLSGPYCTMLLADMGARVIKVERPGHGDDTRAWGPPFVGKETAYFLSINRNKESLTLDFKNTEGREILAKLISKSDVVVENFRPGAMARLGLDYSTLAARHPRLVFCSISGFGQDGPRRDQAGYDAVIQAEGGLMSVTGDADGRAFRVGVAVTDMVAGLLAVQGILLALFARERSGRGQHVDISMLDGVISLLSYHASIYLTTGAESRRVGNRHATIAPYDTFAASDGELFLAVGNDEQFQRFCAATGLQHLLADDRFSTNPARVRNEAALKELLEPVMRERTRDGWLREFATAGVPCGAVRSVPEALSDPQVDARRMVEAVVHAVLGPMKVLGTPIKLSDTPASVRTAPPTLGQHTDTVLGELGLTADEIAGLRKRSVV